MKKSSSGNLSFLLTLIISIGLIVFGITEGWSQQKKKVSYNPAAEKSKYSNNQGSLRYKINFDIKTGLNGERVEVEYWLEK